MLKKLKRKEEEKVEEKKTTSETTGSEVVDLLNPAFDPDIPEQKQRWLR